MLTKKSGTFKRFISTFWIHFFAQNSKLVGIDKNSTKALKNCYDKLIGVKFTSSSILS